MIDPRIALFGIGSLLFTALIVIQLTAGTREGSTVTPAVARRDGGQYKQPSPPPPIEPLVATILARPLFSPDRRPIETTRSTGADLKDKRLAGIMIEPHRRLAIFAVTGAKPLALTEGDSVDGWQIKTITADEIALVSAQGSRTLQLMPAPDSSEGRTQPRKIAARSGAAILWRQWFPQKQNAAAEAAKSDSKTPAAAPAKPPVWAAGSNGMRPPANVQTSRNAPIPSAPQPSAFSRPVGSTPGGPQITQPPPESQRSSQSLPAAARAVGQRE